MRFLKYGSLPAFLFLLGSCHTIYYGALVSNPKDTTSILPAFSTLQRELYRCTVDGHFLFRKFHLSGVLLFKKLEDSSTRVVFANESGLTFFDFSWSRSDSFYVVQIIPQLDKQAVIKTLRKDLELVLFKGLKRETEMAFKNMHDVHCCRHFGVRHPERWHRFERAKGFVYYVQVDDFLRLIETTNGVRPVTSVYLLSPAGTDQLSDSISIVHHRAHFTITAKKLMPTDAE